MAYMTPSVRRAVKSARRHGWTKGDGDLDRPGMARRLARSWLALGLVGKTLSGVAVLALGVVLMQPAQARINPEIETTSAQESIATTEAQAIETAQAAPDLAVPPQPRPEAIEIAATAAPEDIRGPVTRLPLPRYVSLKGNEGNVRRGPSLSHRIDWVFRHSGMPLRVVGEYGNWRRVVDRDGAGGWVHYILLSPVRTAIVQQDMVEMRSRPDLNAGVVAMIENGVIMRLGQCNPDWCRISGNGATGWVPKAALWGVDAHELRD